MISFLASPKPFRGVAKTIQYRAIESWLASSPGSEVILYGRSEGIVQAGLDLGASVFEEVDHTPSGIPYFGAVVEHAAAKALHDRQVYLNCDILLKGANGAFESVPLERYLMIGHRIDLSDGIFVDLRAADWQDVLLALAKEDRAKMHAATGMDYFAFLRGTFTGLPPIVIGRAGYDCAILAHCLRHGIPVIDATEGVVALHQFHDYGHVAGGKAAVFSGEDAINNFAYSGGRRSALLITDASHVLRRSHIAYWPCRGDILRQMELWIRFECGLFRLGLVLRPLWRLLSALGMLRRRSPTMQDVVRAVERGKSEQAPQVYGRT